MHLVLSVIASSILAGSILYSPGLQSTKTGIRLFWTIGVSVVGKVTAGVITSSPFYI